MENQKQTKKDLIRQYKEKPMQGGVCGIVNAGDGGKTLLEATSDIAGSRNRFNFFVQNGGSLPSFKLAKAPQPIKREDLTFTVFEELPQGETQSAEEYKKDLKVLLELWQEKIGAENLY